MHAERLAAQDATLWCAQAPDAPLQIGALCLFDAAPLRDERGVLRMDDVREHLAHRLHHLRRFRTRLASLPFDQGLVWIDDERFDLAHHVRSAALPHPGGDAELREFVARLLEVPLDPRRPLWEVWVIEGVAGDRVAVVPKFSHVMADGMAALEFALAVLDPDPDAVVAGGLPEWEPEPPPGTPVLVGREWLERGRLQAGILGGFVRSLRRPDRLVRRATRLGRVGRLSTTVAPGLPLTGPVGPHRDFGWVQLPLEGLLEAKRAEQVTLNDVILTVVAGGVRHYLAARGASADVAPRVLVPVSLHVAAGDEFENRFSLMIAGLPVAIADPVARLRWMHEEMQRRKAASQSDLGPLLFALGGLVPPVLLRMVGPALLERQPFVNLAVTDLPGTRERLYLLGSPLLELFPYVGVTGNIAVIVGALSYGDGLGIGITVDADVVPDVELLVEGIEQSARALVDAVRLRKTDGP